MSEDNIAVRMLRSEIGSCLLWSFNLSVVSIAAAMNGTDGWSQFGGVAAILFAMTGIERICDRLDRAAAITQGEQDP